jgi:hypothetical protein
MSTSFQNAQRAAMKVVALRWNSTLTEAQRTAWRAFTEGYPLRDQLGQVYTPSGFNRFTQCNLASYVYAGTFLNDPPDALTADQPTAVSITIAQASPATLQVNMQGTLAAGEYWVLQANDPKNPGRYNPGETFRPLASGQNALPYTADVTAAYLASFKPLVTGQRVWVLFSIANTTTGTLSKRLLATALIT